MALAEDNQCRYYYHRYGDNNSKFCTKVRYDAWACLNCITNQSNYKRDIKKNFPEAYPELG